MFEASRSPHDQFVDQFEWDGGDWLYRCKMTGPAYRVADEEKDAFVDAFDRRQREFIWTLMGAYLAIFVVLLFLRPGQDRFADNWLGKDAHLVTLTILFSLGLRFGNDHFAFCAPLRKLGSRALVAPALSRELRHRVIVNQWSWTRLFRDAVAMTLLIVVMSLFVPLDDRPRTLTEWVLLIIPVGLLLLTFAQMAGKWWLERTGQTANNLI